MGMFYQVEELVVPAFAHVVGSGITVDCSIIRTIIQQDAVGYPPVKRNQQRHVQPQERLQNLCRNLATGQKTIAEFLCGVGWNIRLNHQHYEHLQF
jgi:hypothetical protein